MITAASNGRRPLVAELVGPAGAGKSALSERLARQPGVLRASVWNLPRGPWLLAAVRSLPTLMALCVATRALPWADMRQIIRLRTLRHLLTHRWSRHAPLVVLDEGPVFALAWLLLFGHRRGRDGAMTRWWRSTVRAWAATVDVVVSLDAPDAVLAGRIRGREKPHRVKQSSDGEIGAFTAAYRQAFRDVIAALRAENGVQVVALGSEEEAVDHTAERLLRLLEESVHGE